MKKLILAIAFLIVIAGLILLKFLIFDKEKKVAGKKAVDPAIPVEIWIVRDTTATFDITTIGTLRANESTEILPEISKKVTGIFMTEGSFVSKNQLLFKLDDADIVARLDKLNIEEELAVANEGRAKALLSKGGISQERYDEIANILNQIRAEISILKVDLSKTEIRAPFNGKVGLRNVSLGALVNPSTILTTLQDVHLIKLDFTVPERYANEISSGSMVTFTLGEVPGTFQATIEACEPSVDLHTRSLMIRAITSNPGYILTPGVSAKIHLQLGKAVSSLFVPSNCLIPTQQGYFVYISTGGRATQRAVQPGLRGIQMIQILKGLSEGDSVIVTNTLKLRKDSHVTVVKVI